MRKRALSLILCSSSAIASAQVTTNCQQVGSMTNCQSTITPAASKVATEHPASQPVFDAMPAGAALAMSQGARRDEAFLQVGHMIAEGKCDGAKRLAAFYGDKLLLKRTMAACP
jgi:hypothetical protein